MSALEYHNVHCPCMSMNVPLVVKCSGQVAKILVCLSSILYVNSFDDVYRRVNDIINE